MKAFIALAVAVALIPAALGAGWALHAPPSTPTFLESVQGKLQSDGEAHEVYSLVVTSGQYEGQASDGFMAAATSTDNQLRAQLGGDFKWQRVTCRIFSTSGNPEARDDPWVAQYCVYKDVTRKDVETALEKSLQESMGTPPTGRMTPSS